MFYVHVHSLDICHGYLCEIQLNHLQLCQGECKLCKLCILLHVLAVCSVMYLYVHVQSLDYVCRGQSLWNTTESFQLWQGECLDWIHDAQCCLLLLLVEIIAISLSRHLVNQPLLLVPIFALWTNRVSFHVSLSEVNALSLFELFLMIHSWKEFWLLHLHMPSIRRARRERGMSCLWGRGWRRTKLKLFLVFSFSWGYSMWGTIAKHGVSVRRSILQDSRIW